MTDLEVRPKRQMHKMNSVYIKTLHSLGDSTLSIKFSRLLSHAFLFLNTTTVYYTTELTTAVNNHGSSICPFPDALSSSDGTTV